VTREGPRGGRQEKFTSSVRCLCAFRRERECDWISSAMIKREMRRRLRNHRVAQRDELRALEFAISEAVSFYCTLRSSRAQTVGEGNESSPTWKLNFGQNRLHSSPLLFSAEICDIVRRAAVTHGRFSRFAEFNVPRRRLSRGRRGECARLISFQELKPFDAPTT